MKKLLMLFLILPIMFTWGCAEKKLIVVETMPTLLTETPTEAPTESPLETPAEAPSVKPTATPTEAPVDYSRFEGNWISSDTAITRDEVFSQGGSAIQFIEINRTHAIGNIVSVSESFGHRDASVDFDAEIIDDTLEIIFEDDGWENYGTINIRFTANRLLVVMESHETSNLANWNIGYGEYEYVREIIGS